MSLHPGRLLSGLIAAAILSHGAAVEVRQTAGRQSPAAPRKIVRTAGQMTPLPPPGNLDGNWPSFRGIQASGVADGQSLPDTWNGQTGENILWRTPVPGLAHSSPIVWGDRVYVTTAVSERDNATFLTGMTGIGTPSDDLSRHRWMLFALDRRTGRVAWERAAYEGTPLEKRHVKSTYASATPATDGRIVVAWFGSHGVYAYNMDGSLRWKVDLGHLDVGAYDVPTLEWGTASSPVIWNDLVFLQCDTHTDSFMLALNASTGDIVWKTERDELPAWGTPTVVTTPTGPQLVANGSKFIRAYEPLTGKELWRLGPTSQITVPTPFLADGLIVVASGRGPERPIFAIRPAARGDISLKPGESSESVAWSRSGRGPYMPTPLAYKGVLYVLNNNAVFQTYKLASGEQIYETRVPQTGGGFLASPVAADGKIYMMGEDGDVIVLATGPEFRHIATNPMGEPLMATPALSRGVMFVRTPSNVFAISHTERPLPIGAGAARVPLPAAVPAPAAPPPLLIVVSTTDGSPNPFVGTWEAENLRLANPMTMTLKVSGNRISGDVVFAQLLKIESGSIDGNRITFKMDSPNGQRIVTFTGTLKGDEIAFVRTVEVKPGGEPGGPGIFGVGGIPQFVAKRTRRQP